MSAFSSAQAEVPANRRKPLKVRVLERIKPYLVPYYLAVGALLGAITVGFAVVVGLIILVVTNFNVLSLIE